MTTSTVDQLDPDLWIRRYQPSAVDSPRLICFPHAGGSASAFVKLAALLAPDVEVLAVQYPGRQDRRNEPCAGTVEDLAASIAATSDAWSTGTYAFFGHSMGAVLAYEVARRLSRDDRPGPVRMFASGRRAPSRLRPETVHQRDDAGLLAEMRLLGGTDERLLADPEILALALGAQPGPIDIDLTTGVPLARRARRLAFLEGRAPAEVFAQLTAARWS